MPVRRAVALPLCALALGAPAAQADVQGPAKGREVVLVANAEGGTVSILDAHTAKVLRSVDVLPDGARPSVDQGDPPFALVNQQLITGVGGVNVAQDQDLSPDGTTLYVSRGHRGDVAAFDLRTGDLRWKVPIPGLRADHMTLSADGRRLYVSALTANEVVVVDTGRRRIVGAVPTGQWPHDNHLSEDGSRLYNSSIGTIVLPEPARAALTPPPYQLTVVDTASLRVVQRFTFDRGIRPTAYTKDGATLFAQRSLESSIMRVRLADGRVERVAQLPVKDGTTEADFDFEAPHHGLALSSDERTLCVAGRVSDYVALVATDTLQPRRIIPVGDAPGWAVTSPDGRRCFVTNTRDDTVSVIGLREERELARVRVGDGPKHAEAARIPEAVLCTSQRIAGCAGDLRFARRCVRGGRLRLTVGGDVDAVQRVRFRLGGNVLATDSAPPFERTVRAPRRHPGEAPLVAAITTSEGVVRRERSAPVCR
ncbi:hypothetical protein [Conexibacter sp. SYSU D00693]|uniref:hypothetical protein n=1 Tax=Conexibacter sp. SYSU D00693 TaxID=2812560 RepID=UPI00196A6C82|nr:hypothetical protein [Conexibacter sp. SYSU D00693]